MANDKEAKNKKETKNKKSFFKDFKAELKKVIWPTPKQLVNSTIAVVVIVIITAAIVFVLDVAFDLFNKHEVNKLKSKIRGYEVEDVQDGEQTSDEIETTENETSEEELPDEAVEGESEVEQEETVNE